MSESVSGDEQRPDGAGESPSTDPAAIDGSSVGIEGTPIEAPEDSVELTDSVEEPDPAESTASTPGSRMARVIERPDGEQQSAPVVPQFSRLDCTDPATVGHAADQARHALEAGECVVLPTDTVYGIGADAFNAKAVQRLLDAKGRGRDMPPPVLIADASLVRALASDVPQASERLTKAFWPGALTVILTARETSRMDLGETEGTIALRVPDHDLARTLLRQTGPMAVSSANLSGRAAALDCDEAVEQLGDRVSVYLDGGRLGDFGRPPSTIVDFSRSEHGQLLRLGALSLDQLREVCPELADLPENTPVQDAEPETNDEDSPSTGSGHEGDGSGREGDGSGHDPSTISRSSDDDESGLGEAGIERVRDRRSLFTLQPPRG